MLMRFISPDIGNKADATGIMFKLRIVQTWIFFHNNWFYATDNTYFHRFYKPFISIRLLCIGQIVAFRYITMEAPMKNQVGAAHILPRTLAKQSYCDN